MAKANAKATTETAATLLADARAALERGDHADACSAIVRAWTAVPSPRIAALAARAAKRLPRRELPSAMAAREAAWLELARTRDPGVLPTLLGLDWPVHPRGGKARLAELVQFPPDPRIAESILTLWQAGRYRSNASPPFWKLGFRTIAGWGDPRPGQIVKRLDAWNRDAYFHNVRGLPTDLTVDAATAREIAALEAVIDRANPAPVSRDALFAAVYAEPESDAPRAVLGDALVSDDDPRGELILLQLQLAAKPDKKAETRVRALLRDHAKQWTAGIASERACTFRRGFVAAVRGGTPPSPKALANPAWRCVDELDLHHDLPATQVARALAHPNLAGVRTLAGVRASSLAKLAGKRHFDRLVIHAPLARLPAGITMRELWLRRPPSGGKPVELDTYLAWVASLPQLGSVRVLAVDLEESALADAAAWLVAKAPRTLEQLTLAPTNIELWRWQLDLTRAPGKAVAIAATWQGNLYGERYPEGLGAALAAMPKGSIARFSAHAKNRPDATRKKRLEQDLARGLRAHGLPTPNLVPKRVTNAR